MNSSSSPDYSPELQRLMQQAGLYSLSELSRKAGVSERQLIRLQRGLALNTRVDILLKISQGLNISLEELLLTFAPTTVSTLQNSQSGVELEYQRLQQQIEQQGETLRETFQIESLQVLESWLLQWPTVAYRAQQNPQLAAVKLLPLLHPIEQLMQQWGVEAIATVGSQVAYDPQYHQLMEGNVQPGEPVLVRYTGYRYREKLLYRAKVSPV
ncbi:MAG: helix-turn-helix domain-containing protein [Microcoleaceae cyanobacterium]